MEHNLSRHLLVLNLYVFGHEVFSYQAVTIGLTYSLSFSVAESTMYPSENDSRAILKDHGSEEVEQASGLQAGLGVQMGILKYTLYWF